VAQLLVVRRPVDVVVIGPAEARNVTVDWSADLPAGATITASVFLPPPEITVGVQTFVAAATAARLSWVTAGQPGRRYKMHNRVDLSDGEIYVYPFDVRCKE
jgi:hypothetical protein